MHPLNDVPAWRQPYPFWFWNGKLEASEIRRQLTLMREVGITEFVIHGRTGLQTPFLSDEWFDMVRVAVDEAARTGMRAWIYDEYNWPSGTAASTITADPAKREHYLAADGALRTEEHPHRSPLSVDYLNPECTREFIRRCYQSYYDRFQEHFGRAIAGFFNDEARFANPYPWSPVLGTPPARKGYYCHLGDLVVRNHFGMIRQWCDERQVLFTGHVMGEETLGSQARYMGDAWKVISQYHWPGVDHLGTAAQGHHPRLAASVANLTGSRMVTCETFAGCPWDFTLQDMYRIAGWLYANGVTRILLHGFFYTREGEAARDWPPDIFFRWPGWEDMPEFIHWAGRIQYFLARAVPKCRVALYYPHEEFCRDYVPAPGYTLNYTDAARIENETARAYHLEFGRLMNAMIKRGIDFDIVPAHLLDRVTNHILVVPYHAKPAFKGTLLSQGDAAAEECIEALDDMLGRRIRVFGEFAAPRPRPVSENISDPYIHEARDDGGVWVKSFLFDGTPAIMIWNANDSQFDGACDLVEKRPWTVWLPANGSEIPLGDTDSCTISLRAHSMAVVLGK